MAFHRAGGECSRRRTQTARVGAGRLSRSVSYDPQVGGGRRARAPTLRPDTAGGPTDSASDETRAAPSRTCRSALVVSPWCRITLTIRALSESIRSCDYQRVVVQVDRYEPALAVLWHTLRYVARPLASKHVYVLPESSRVYVQLFGGPGGRLSVVRKGVYWPSSNTLVVP